MTRDRKESKEREPFLNPSRETWSMTEIFPRIRSRAILADLTPDWSLHKFLPSTWGMAKLSQLNMLGVTSTENLNQGCQRKKMVYGEGCSRNLSIYWIEKNHGLDPPGTAILSEFYENCQDHGKRTTMIIIIAVMDQKWTISLSQLLLVSLMIFYFSACKYSLIHSAGLW